ncbi:MAG: class I SAM-dependent methyltransferase [Patescibacteria group bacterium]|nr:class I SAM-dependent methyltransferase [Patescibacteria group bacterium]
MMRTKKDISEALRKSFDLLGDAARDEGSEWNRLVLTLGLADEHSGGLEGKRFLDVGSSVGVMPLAASFFGTQTSQGLDKFIFPDTFENPFRMTPEQFARVRKLWQENRMEVLKHDIADPLPYADGTVDVITCNALIEHVHGLHKHLFSEFARVLAPGGIVIVTTPNIAMLLKRLRFFVGRTPLWDFEDYFRSGTEFTGHIREFTVNECKQMFVWSGLEPVKVFSRATYFKWKWLRKPQKWIQLVTQGLSFLSPNFGDLVIAIGRKARE